MNTKCNVEKKITCRRFSELWLHVLFTCNLTCTHCLFSCSPNKLEKGELTLMECRNHTITALEMGVEAIYITGGEPLLWPYLEDFISWYYKADRVVPMTVLTNGTLIDLEKAAFIKQYSSQGLNIRVSLECYTKDNHDQYRGEGSFARALKGIKNLNDCGIRPWVAYVNKSGGGMEQHSALKLEEDFRERLDNDFGLEISGLKIISAYSKGRFFGKVDPQVCPEQISHRINTVQCNYTLAVSKEGTFPCPILVDVPEARIPGDFKEATRRDFSLDHKVCASCFATGSSCGQ